MSRLRKHITRLRVCELCPDMVGPVVVGTPVRSPVMLLGQAPGPHEGKIGKPFAWSAGKVLFKWFSTIGIDEERFRKRVYIAAVCRCYPGKQPDAWGDRVPTKKEMANCSPWFEREIEIIRPRLLLPVGRLAIGRVMKLTPLKEIVGKQHRVTVFGHELDVIPLPHPSGLSTWYKTEPGKALTQNALRLIRKHQAFRSALL